MHILHRPRYDVELFQRIETLIGKKLPAFPTQEEEVMMLVERVSEAQRFARLVSAPVGVAFYFFPMLVLLKLTQI